MKKIKWNDFLLDVAVTLILCVLSFICLYPLWFVLMASFSSTSAIDASKGILFWPVNFSLNSYVMVFQHKLFVSGFINTIKILLMSLPINLVLTLLCGYFLSCSGMMFKKPITGLILFTMYFSGGMIPGYLNIRDLGLYNSLWALVLTGAMSVYNSIICKTAIESIPESLKESAYIDGANDIQILYKIVVGLIKPTLAVLTLYYAVGHWGSWFNASIYLKDNDLLPIQNILRSVLIEQKDSMQQASREEFMEYVETIKYAAVVITTAPILCVYPFLQKYFTKGVMIGAVKG